MSDVIQPLLDRIQSEGLKQAESERDALLAEAKVKADALLAEAKSEAERIRVQAEADAEATESRGTVALQQAARDVLLQLRTEIARQVKLAAQSAAGASLASADVVSKLIAELVNAQTRGGTVTVTTSPALADTVKAALPALLKDAEGATVVMDPNVQSGFQLRFGDSAEGVDVTDTAVAEWLSAGLRKDLADLLAPVPPEA